MFNRHAKARVQRGALSSDEAEQLFSTVDHTGHSDEERARAKEIARRAGTGEERGDGRAS